MQEDLFQLRERGKTALARGDLDTAADAFVSAAMQTHVGENDYLSVLHPLVGVLARRNDTRSALTVTWYIAMSEKRGWQQALAMLPKMPHVDRGRTLAMTENLAGAAREFETSGYFATAAIAHERANDWQSAEGAWTRLTQTRSRRPLDAYHSALVHFNLARCAKRTEQPRKARDAIIASVRLLEAAADTFESAGLRERAFDCFQVLIRIGGDGGAFEDVLEGYVNCIRILREDNLKYFALQYFDEAIATAKERKEYSAAATLSREAGTYARAIGMASTATHYLVLQADLWRDVAKQYKERGAPTEFGASALLSAVLAFGEAGRFSRVGILYRELAEMDLDPAKIQHFARAALRYDGIVDEPLEATTRTKARSQDHFPDVWHVDLIEWEQAGSAVEACGDILLDERWPDLVRRKAMLARLTAIAVEAHPNDTRNAAESARLRLADQLAQMQLYAVLSPLEALFENAQRSTKIAVLSAMKQLYFKRTFVTVREGLRDHDALVVEHAAKVVESLYFHHAFDPLARIVREAPQPAVRASALRALARIDTVEAAEFLLGVLEHGAPTDRSAALEGLKRTRGGRFAELARSALPSARPEVQAVLRQWLNDRSISVSSS
jgi:tetratricopeptide (TPR) repeat protein